MISTEDRVNKPNHYIKNGFEVIEVIESKGWGYDFCMGNVIKYCLRAGDKAEEGMTKEQKELEDLQKAKWYLERAIKIKEAELNDINEDN